VAGTERTWKFEPLLLTDLQGVRNDQRLGRQIFLHGLRFNLQIQTKIDTTWSEWQNGHIHFALCQATDDSFLEEDKKPTFSTPIGAATNDLKDFASIDQNDIGVQDLRYGKLKNDEYKVITHRKYFAGKMNSFGNDEVCSTRQFYIPIKKNIIFDNAADQYGQRPFFLLVWYVPTNNYKEPLDRGDRIVYVNARHSAYFKTHT
jgi:hypothetical protein